MMPGATARLELPPGARELAGIRNSDPRKPQLAVLWRTHTPVSNASIRTVNPLRLQDLEHVLFPQPGLRENRRCVFQEVGDLLRIRVLQHSHNIIRKRLIADDSEDLPRDGGRLLADLGDLPISFTGMLDDVPEFRPNIPSDLPRVQPASRLPAGIFPSASIGHS